MPGFIEFPDRTVFCHSDDKDEMASYVLSPDIEVKTSRYLQRGQYLASKDIICEPKMETRYLDDDFLNNKITIIVTPIFK